eukprot:CAMPEP_0185550336 /NCGR_PEP_ID=MMETSP1381-20130426/20228_1 /TAXON_ID=298111 /ORGANISM="Pavlova sp., Strain CCMP459" /LENGTH=183 /DNA_ID=CAMNT_0028163119 /DNA_START=232 /DNA_END=780 /DNA_ORIENTATION=+
MAFARVVSAALGASRGPAPLAVPPLCRDAAPLGPSPPRICALGRRATVLVVVLPICQSSAAPRLRLVLSRVRGCGCRRPAPRRAALAARGGAAPVPASRPVRGSTLAVERRASSGGRGRGYRRRREGGRGTVGVRVRGISYGWPLPVARGDAEWRDRFPVYRLVRPLRTLWSLDCSPSTVYPG